MGSVFLESTEVPDTRTVMEIQELLARKGAICVQVEYAAGCVVSVSFQLRISRATQADFIANGNFIELPTRQVNENPVSVRGIRNCP